MEYAKYEVWSPVQSQMFEWRDPDARPWISLTAFVRGKAQRGGIPFTGATMKRLLLLLFLFPGLAPAGTLYRCVGAGGQVSYLATPCAAGQRMDRSIEFAPEPDSPMLGTISGRKGSNTATGRSVSRSRGGTGSRSRVDPCLQAKAKRGQQLDRLGLKRTFSDLSRLDEPVRKACGGF